jgi:aspartyl protease
VASLTVLLDVPIRFDVGGTTTHAPTVDVLVNGTPTRLILDTGSTDHVLTIDLVRAAGLAHEPGEPGTDHAGSSVDSWFVGDLELEIDSIGFGLHDAVAITGPAPFAGWGVGGFLSPQHVHPIAHAVIDLVADRFILVEGEDDAVDRWVRARSPFMTRLELERDPAEATPVVSAAIEPFEAVPTMLNTGGRGTEFAVAAVPGLVGAAAADAGKGVGGDPVRASMVEHRTLLLGGEPFPIARLLIRDEIDTMLGLVGMDVLRGTIVVVGADRERPVRLLR